MVFFQLQKWSSFGLIFMKLGLPEKLGTLLLVRLLLPGLPSLDSSFGWCGRFKRMFYNMTWPIHKFISNKQIDKIKLDHERHSRCFLDDWVNCFWDEVLSVSARPHLRRDLRGGRALHLYLQAWPAPGLGDPGLPGGHSETCRQVLPPPWPPGPQWPSDASNWSSELQRPIPAEGPWDLQYSPI